MKTMTRFEHIAHDDIVLMWRSGRIHWVILTEFYPGGVHRNDVTWNALAMDRNATYSLSEDNYRYTFNDLLYEMTFI